MFINPDTEPQKAEKPVQPAKPEKTVPKPAAEETKTNPPIEGNWIMDQSKCHSNYPLLSSLFAQCPLPRNTPSPPIQKEQPTTETSCCGSRILRCVRTPHRSWWTRNVSDLPTLPPSCKFIWKREKARRQNVMYLILENVEHCGGEPEQADTGYSVIDEWRTCKHIKSIILLKCFCLLVY